MTVKHTDFRLIVKRGVQCLLLPLAFVAWCVYRLESLVVGKRTALACWSQCLALLPGRCGILVRWAFFYLAARRCSWDVTIEFGTIMSSPDIEIGRHVYIGAYCVLGDVRLGDDVRIASGVSIPSGGRQHWEQIVPQDGLSPLPEVPNQYRQITIGQRAWIGERAVVLADVGASAIVGAGSVVTSPVEDFCVVAGVPARTIRRLSAS